MSIIIFKKIYSRFFSKLPKKESGDEEVGDKKEPAEQRIQHDKSDTPSENIVRDHIDRTDFLLDSIPDSASFLKGLKYCESKNPLV